MPAALVRRGRPACRRLGARVCLPLPYGPFSAVPRELDEDGMAAVREDFVAAAKRAAELASTSSSSTSPTATCSRASSRRSATVAPTPTARTACASRSRCSTRCAARGTASSPCAFRSPTGLPGGVSVDEASGRPRARRARLRPRPHGRGADCRRGTARVPPRLPDRAQRPRTNRCTGADARRRPSHDAGRREHDRRRRPRRPLHPRPPSVRPRARAPPDPSTRSAAILMTELGLHPTPTSRSSSPTTSARSRSFRSGRRNRTDRTRRSRRTRSSRSASAGARPSGSRRDPDPRARPATTSIRRHPLRAGFPGAVTIGEETLRALVVEIARSLAEQGFGRIVLVNSHFEPEQVRTLREAVAELGPSARLLDLTRRRNAERLTEEFRSGSCHAGRYETSLVLADRPELVREERRAARNRG